MPDRSGHGYLYFDAFGSVARLALPAVRLTMLAYSPAGDRDHCRSCVTLSRGLAT
ncbi:MAG: hypothetical protein IPI83_07760 [Sphingomonadales bacterium]|nr:hypothetical protein [Sphingomonadales bacterium]